MAVLPDGVESRTERMWLVVKFRKIICPGRLLDLMYLGLQPLSPQAPDAIVIQVYQKVQAMDNSCCICGLVLAPANSNFPR